MSAETRSREEILRDDIFIADEFSIWRFVLNDLLTNGYVVWERDTGAIAIVDPGDRGDDLAAAAASWGGDVHWILVTHLHGDHCAQAERVREATGGRIVAPPGGMVVPDRPVAGGEVLEFGAHEVQVCATPGHSPESVSYQIGPHLFLGDFLFRLGSGRTDGARASTADLFRVVRETFASLPEEAVLWCGHGPPSTVGEELAGNPFWRVALAAGPVTPVGKVVYHGATVPVLAWADDYDGGRKALLELADGSLVIVPGSQVQSRKG
jgi:glyoxylase-like metal-dependent hydrolase (beta-lactamase superfamily II)